MRYEGLTDEEEDFLRYHRGGIFDSLQATIDGRKHVTVVEEAHEKAKEAMDDLIVVVPSRTHRVLYLAATAKAATEARDKLLEEIMLTMMGWHQSDDSGVWGWVPVLSYDLEYLADLVGLTVQTVRRRYDALMKSTYVKLNAEKEADAEV